MRAAIATGRATIEEVGLGDLPLHARGRQRPQEDLGGTLGTRQRTLAVQSGAGYIGPGRAMLPVLPRNLLPLLATSDTLESTWIDLGQLLARLIATTKKSAKGESVCSKHFDPGAFGLQGFLSGMSSSPMQEEEHARMAKGSARAIPPFREPKELWFRYRSAWIPDISNRFWKLSQKSVFRLIRRSIMRLRSCIYTPTSIRRRRRPRSWNFLPTPGSWTR